MAAAQDTLELSVPPAEDRNVSNVRRGAYVAQVSERLYRGHDGRIITYVSLEDFRSQVARLNTEGNLSGDNAWTLNTAATDARLRELGYRHAAFDDIFARGPERLYLWERLDNNLVVPRLRDGTPVRESRTSDGCRQVLRIVMEHGQPVAEEWVSAGNGLIVAYTPTGMAAVVKPIESHASGTEVHWYFDDNLDEAAVLRDGSWGDARVGCFGLGADRRASVSASGIGFRLVRGSLESQGSRPMYDKLFEWPQLAAA